MVPPAAISNAPWRAATALVNAPRSWPKSSLSSRSGGTAPQSTTTSGPARRALAACTDSAATSLPVPVSPSSRSVASDAAARASRANTARIATEPPTMPPKLSASASGILTGSSPSSKRSWLRPSRSDAPSDRYACSTDTSPTKVPLRLPRSRTVMRPFSTAIWQWKRDTVLSRRTISARSWVPMVKLSDAAANTAPASGPATTRRRIGGTGA